MIEKDIALVGAQTISWFAVETNEVTKAIALVEKYRIAKEDIRSDFLEAVKRAKENADRKMIDLQTKTKEELALL